MPHRLLVVEDETPLRDLLRDIFTLEGCEVTTATDGREGWARLTEGRFDLVLLNVMLPYIDGRALLRRIRADPALRATPVVLMSANHQPAIVEADGAAAFVAKPFDLDHLVETIARALDTAYP